MMKRNIPTRIDPIFKKALEESAIQRVRNQIDNEIRTPREMTEMMMNAPSRIKLFNELATIPRKEDIKKLK